jgi:hypothetical protein
MRGRRRSHRRSGARVALLTRPRQNPTMHSRNMPATSPRRRATAARPAIGRDGRSPHLQVLSRRTKNNPVLIGEPGSARPRSSRSRVRIVNGDVRKPEAKAARSHGRDDAGAKYAASSRNGQSRAAGSDVSAGACILLSTRCIPSSAPARSTAPWTPEPARRAARGELHCISAHARRVQKHVERTPRSPAASSRSMSTAERRGYDLDPAPLKDKYEAHRRAYRRRAGRGGDAVASLSPTASLPDKAFILVVKRRRG